jgi:mono/diheme cytochrome c family protein
MTRVALSLSLLPLFGCGRPYERDHELVSMRYELKHKGECQAWLKSSVTGYKYCSSPPFVVMPAETVAAAPTFASMTTGPTDEAALRAHGEKVYAAVCQTCHQADGKGLPGSFPPLAGAGSFYGAPENHARIVVHGLSGAIEVNGTAFNGVMPPQGGALSDYDIAAVTSYERTSWGNADGVVLPEQVASVR